MKRARQTKARAAKAAANRTRIGSKKKSRYGAKRERAAKGNFNPTSPFYVTPGTEEQEEARRGKDDGLDTLVKFGLCTERVRDELRGVFRRPRFEEDWS